MADSRANYLTHERWVMDGWAELYDLQADPNEHRELSAEHPDRARALLDLLHGWRRSLDAPMPSPLPEASRAF